MAKPKIDIRASRQSLLDTKERQKTAFQSVEYNIEEEIPKVDKVWDLTCPEQVTQLANNNPGHFWDWLCNIAAERDSFRTHLESIHKQYEDLESKSDADLDAANEKTAKWRTKALKLEQQLQQLDAAALNRDSSLPLAKKKSTKQPDPPVFTDGLDPTWDDWSSKIHEKMRVNSDHFLTEDAKVVYVLSRLGGQAVTYTLYRRGKTDNPYLAYEDILDQLAETYEDSDRLENARRDLVRLQMLERPLKAFIADFQRMAHASKLAEDHLIQLLREKLPSRLKKPMLAQNAVAPFASLKDLKDYLVRLDNSHLHDLPARIKPSRPAAVQTTRVTDKKTTTTTPSRKNGTARVPVCYTCGEIGHFKFDKTLCKEDHQTPKGKAAQDAAVNEIQIADMEDASGHSSAESASDSGNE